MPVQSEKNQEKLVNKIMFLYILGVAISGWGFVMIMLNGGVRFSADRRGRHHNQSF